MPAYPEDSVTVLVTDPERLARYARWAVEDILAQCIQYGQPTRYSDEALRRRAAKDTGADLEADAGRLGFTHTPAEAEAYRRIYTDAFLSAWHDEALHSQVRERQPRGFLIVCYR